jgi:hypothetical protein
MPNAIGKCAPFGKQVLLITRSHAARRDHAVDAIGYDFTRFKKFQARSVSKQSFSRRS